jgi:hypothetical protein
MDENLTTWKVEGANWSWTGDLPSTVSPMEVATRVVERLSNPSLWGDGFADGLMVKVGQNPQLGMIMVLSNSEMKSFEEQLVILSEAVVANAGLHDKARQLREAQG